MFADLSPSEKTSIKANEIMVFNVKVQIPALADLAKYFKLPTILTTSFEDGPNGPLLRELKNAFPGAPYIARPGQINAWSGGCKWKTASVVPSLEGKFSRYFPKLKKGCIL
jgi:hypothetical protein